jgi:hypothetical protein
LLAFVFTGAAIMKLRPSVEEMVERKQLSPNASPIPLRVLGILELWGGIGIIVPQLIHVYPVLTPITAVCFCLVLIGALVDKIKTKQLKMLPLIFVCIILSVAVAYYRF